MPYCSKCGAKLGEDVRFCSSCGTFIAEPERRIKTVEKNSEVKPALLTAVKSGEPYVLDVVIDMEAPIPPIAGEWYEPVKHRIKPRPRSRKP